MTQILEHGVKSVELEEMVLDIETALAGKEKHAAVLACLTYAILLQAPDTITPEQLQTCLDGASKYVAQFVTTLRDGSDLPAGRMN